MGLRHVTNNSHRFVVFENLELPHNMTMANEKALPAIVKGILKTMIFVNSKNKKEFYKSLVCSRN